MKSSSLTLASVFAAFLTSAMAAPANAQQPVAKIMTPAEKKAQEEKWKRERDAAIQEMLERPKKAEKQEAQKKFKLLSGQLPTYDIDETGICTRSVTSTVIGGARSFEPSAILRSRLQRGAFSFDARLLVPDSVVVSSAVVDCIPTVLEQINPEKIALLAIMGIKPHISGGSCPAPAPTK